MTIDTTPSARPRRRMARDHAAAGDTKPSSKLDRIEALLLAEGGATIAGMMAVTGWQQHSVRGAMAGALKKRGLAITSDKIDGLRRYSAVRP